MSNGVPLPRLATGGEILNRYGTAAYAWRNRRGELIDNPAESMRQADALHAQFAIVEAEGACLAFTAADWGEGQDFSGNGGGCRKLIHPAYEIGKGD